MITIKEITNEIYLLQINDDIDQASVEKFLAFLAIKSEKGEKMKMIGEIKSFPGFESFRAFFKTAELKMEAANSISKYAVLSEKDWIEAVVPVGNLITPNIPIKFFEPNERDQAIAWLEAEEVEEEHQDE